jgi:hypothetical protein
MEAPFKLGLCHLRAIARLLEFHYVLNLQIAMICTGLQGSVTVKNFVICSLASVQGLRYTASQ